MITDYSHDAFPGLKFSLDITPINLDRFELKIGVLGPRRLASPWQNWFETWCKRDKFDYLSDPEVRQKSIRTRYVTLFVDRKYLLEIVLNDLSLYIDVGYPLDRNDEITDADRAELERGS